MNTNTSVNVKPVFIYDLRSSQIPCNISLLSLTLWRQEGDNYKKNRKKGVGDLGITNRMGVYHTYATEIRGDHLRCFTTIINSYVELQQLAFFLKMYKITGRHVLFVFTNKRLSSQNI